MKHTIPSDIWEGKKALITKLYKDEEWPLKQVIKQIRSADFNPSETQLRSRLKKWRVTKSSRQTRKPRNDQKCISDDDSGIQENIPQTSPRVPTVPLVNGPEWCTAYEDHMQQTAIPGIASANDRHQDPTLQQSALQLQLQDNESCMPLQLPKGQPSLASYNPTNAPRRADCVLASTAPLPITHNYPNTGYSTPLSSSVQSLLPAIPSSTATGHQADFVDSRVLESVSQWYSQPLTTASQIEWAPLYTCTGLEAAMTSEGLQDQEMQTECLQGL
ncbi:hypothetical protein PHISCL_07950 [Aspergillus sclerotialis]|uniref:Clr5 domain-containing protein n=1 Tax=Aspergillus sclerotialis TaxID=2070753 RepID=A0A3A2ZP92_9EURO|nr:hypothetical protein PHISCL_07950 [Aspergillus sclerotialis]